MNKIQEFLSNVLVIDTETTGLLEDANAEIIEVAGGQLINGQWEVAELLLGSNLPISPEVSSVNYISNKMIEGLPTFEEGIEQVEEILALGNNFVFVAHNAPFDRDMLIKQYKSYHPSRRTFSQYHDPNNWLCTLRLAKVLSPPGAEKFNLGYLRYFLELDVDDALPAHRAAADVTTCGRLLEELLEIAVVRGAINVEEAIFPQLIALCNKPINITKWPFGKHRGKDLNDIPTDYYMWAIENMDFLNQSHAKYDSDLADSVTKALEARL